MDTVWVSMPISDETADKIVRLFEAKKELIEHSAGAGVALHRGEDTVSFEVAGEVDDAMVIPLCVLFSKLCKHAEKQKRITAKPRPVENERYAMRTLLLRLGMIGDEYKDARKALLQNLSGDVAFAHGRPAKRG